MFTVVGSACPDWIMSGRYLCTRLLVVCNRQCMYYMICVRMRKAAIVLVDELRTEMKHNGQTKAAAECRRLGTTKNRLNPTRGRHGLVFCGVFFRSSS